MSQQTQRPPLDGHGVTRRRLLAIGGSAAAAASLPGFLLPARAAAAASWLDRSTYETRIGEIFTMRLESGARFTLRLEAVTGKGRSFDLVFKPTSAVEHAQATRQVSHDALGRTELFLVPFKTPKTTLRYIASINRARS